MKDTGRYRWLVLAPLLMAIAGINHGDRAVPGLFVPLPTKQFGFTPKELGWLIRFVGAFLVGSCRALIVCVAVFSSFAAIGSAGYGGIGAAAAIGRIASFPYISH